VAPDRGLGCAVFGVQEQASGEGRAPGEAGDDHGALELASWGGAVTRMVDRLERAGYVHREANPPRPPPGDHPTGARAAGHYRPHYQGMAAAWTDLLALFLDLFDRMHQLSQQQLASLNEDTPGADTATS
jgi:hypothetical protein